MGEFPMYEHVMITPIVALAAWSLVMLIWLYITRIPAMQKAKLRPSAGVTRAQIESLAQHHENRCDARESEERRG